MTKIKTALIGSFGTEISTAKGSVKFDAEGVAEVSEEVSEYLKSNFPDVYYDAEGEKPTPNSGSFVNPNDDPAVKEFARNHTAGKNAEAAGAPAKVVESSAKAAEKTPAGLVDENGNPITNTEKAEGDDKKEEETEGSKEEETEKEDGESEELDAETVEMLSKLSVKDIHATLVSAGVQDEATAKIKKKDELIPIAAKKLT